jgi:hypothetical protein
MRLCGYFAVFALLLVATAPALAQTGPGPMETTGVSNAVTDAPHAAVADAPATPASAVDRLQPGFGQDLLLSAPATRPDLSADLWPALGSEAMAALDQQRHDRRGGLTWLVVGGSLIGAGLLIGDDAGTVLSVGGALIAVYGVYLMVRN